MPNIKNVLSIAGSDPSGGAGIQADLKTFCANGVYGMAVITALTAQNTQGVSAFVAVPPEFVKDQLKSIFEDIEVSAVKIGMLANANIINSIADSLELYTPPHIVFDPVMVATSGDNLISGDAIKVMKERLIPLCDVLTPNISEAEKLSRKAVLDMQIAAQELLSLGANAVFLKGGHLKGNMAIDVLAYRKVVREYKILRVDTKNTHGTGCTLSSAIAANLAKGYGLEDACFKAKEYLTKALKHADDLTVGNGCGSTHHMWEMQ